MALPEPVTQGISRTSTNKTLYLPDPKAMTSLIELSRKLSELVSQDQHSDEETPSTHDLHVRLRRVEDILLKRNDEAEGHEIAKPVISASSTVH